MRFPIVCLFSLLAIAQSGIINPRIDNRIVGGHSAIPGDYPHQVSLQWGWPPMIKYSHFCGGTILNQEWILTAVHCLEEVEKLPSFGSFVVKAGKYRLDQFESAEQNSTVQTFFKHPKYAGNGTVGPYDIGLIKLNSPLKLNSLVAAAELPSTNSEPSGEVTISGWGAINNDTNHPVMPMILQAVEVPIVDRESCNKAIEKLAVKEGEIINNIVHETNVCTGPLTGGISACRGDSGGPLIRKREDRKIEIVGVASYAVFPCGRKGAPTVYVKVSSFIDWIRKVITANSKTCIPNRFH